MFTKLLVPLDGSPLAAAALPTARTLATSLNASILLVRAIPLSEGSAGVKPAHEYLAGVADELRQDGSFTVSTCLEPGSPADAIVEAATREGADLVVMATHGRSGIERALVGSVAERLLARSPIPLVVLRPGARRLTDVRTLLVPVDGTPGGAVALAHATALARAAFSRLFLLQVVVALPNHLYDPYSVVAADVGSNWEDDARAAAQQYVDTQVERLRKSGLEAEGRVATGAVGEAIEQTAAEIDADLIVMSTHAHTGPIRAVLGSVADAMVRNSGRPVLLVKRGATPAQA
jgi:nucleotide-binding universal stress UspA family protein